MGDTWRKEHNRISGYAGTDGQLETKAPHVERAVTTVVFPKFGNPSPILPVSLALENASDALASAIRNNARPVSYSVSHTCK